jgi:hypothetical protein
MDEGNFSTAIDTLYNDNNDDCNPYDAVTPQQSNGACRSREINRTYEPPSPPTHNFQTDARPKIPKEVSNSGGNGSSGTKSEGFRLPGAIDNLRNIPMKEYLLVIVLFWCAQKPDFVKMLMSYLPVNLRGSGDMTSVIVAVIFTLAVFIGREYLVYL